MFSVGHVTLLELGVSEGKTNKAALAMRKGAYNYLNMREDPTHLNPQATSPHPPDIVFRLRVNRPS